MKLLKRITASQRFPHISLFVIVTLVFMGVNSCRRKPDCSLQCWQSDSLAGYFIDGSSFLIAGAYSRDVKQTNERLFWTVKSERYDRPGYAYQILLESRSLNITLYKDTTVTFRLDSLQSRYTVYEGETTTSFRFLDWQFLEKTQNPCSCCNLPYSDPLIVGDIYVRLTGHLQNTRTLETKPFDFTISTRSKEISVCND